MWDWDGSKKETTFQCSNVGISPLDPISLLLEIFQNPSILGLGPISGLSGNLMRWGALADEPMRFSTTNRALHSRETVGGIVVATRKVRRGWLRIISCLILTE